MERRPLLRQFGKAAARLLWDFCSTLFIVSLVIVLSLASQAALDAGVVSREQLAASKANPLGVVTSIVAHWDMSLLLMNAQALLFFAGAYLFTNIPQPPTERARADSWFALLVFPIAVTVNIVFILISPGSSLGASGLVYAGFGIAFGYFLLNAQRNASDFAALLRIPEENPHDSRKRNEIARAFWWLGMNVALFLVFFYLLLFDRALLFGVGEPGINAFAHLLGFALGFAFTFARNFRTPSVRMEESGSKVRP